jgi:cytochrome P450
MYLLGKHPEILERLHKEIKEVSGGDIKNLKYEEINKLNLLTNVVKESLRLYPPAPINGRNAKEDTQLGGISIPAGTTVVIPSWNIQRNAKYWENPTRFEPERFDRDYHPFAWVPFGAGARVCIGQRLSLMEARVALAHIISNFKFQYKGDEPEVI